MLFCNRQVDEKLLIKLDKLTAICNEYDKGIPTLYRHILTQKRDTESNGYYLQGEEMAGFISIYFFYANACEVSLMIDPNHRRQGLAKQLIKAMLPLFHARELEYVIFSTPSTLHNHWLPVLGFSYQQTVYHMQRTGYEPILINKPRLSIRKATMDDLDMLCAIDHQCFSESAMSMPSRFINLFDDDNYSLFVAALDQQIIGKAHIRWESDMAVFSDIAIVPKFQRQGLGGELLCFCINQSLTNGKSIIALDVETTNRNALDLYLRHGFKITYEHDYWSIPLKRLEAVIKAK